MGYRSLQLLFFSFFSGTALSKAQNSMPNGMPKKEVYLRRTLGIQNELVQ
jgi:hypothetical protein